MKFLTVIIYSILGVFTLPQNAISQSNSSTDILENTQPACTLWIDTGQFTPRKSIHFTLTEFEIPETTIRALEVVDERTVWFAGSNGKWGYTKDDGKNWSINQMVLSTGIPEFRSIAVQENGDIFLVSIRKPAAIYKSSNQGKTWNKVYTDADTNAFFDAIEFWDDQHGILLGDAQNNRFHVAITNDGGQTWKRVSTANLPPALDGENPFAASNTNIAISDTHAWFGTGGTNKSRVYHTPNYGKTWEVFDTPIISGKTMTGIYSIDYRNSRTGVIAGGNWDDVNDTNATLAITNDGGKTWKAVNSPNGFVSCTQFTTQGIEIFTLKGRARGGNSSMSFSNDLGKTWQTFANSNYLAIQFFYQNMAWLSGKNKIAKLTITDP